MITIRLCTPQDIDRLREISERTFRETFAGQNTEEDMKEYVALHFSHDEIRREMETPCSWFFLAADGPDVFGYMKLNAGSAQTEKDYPGSLEVQRIYLVENAKGKHLGSQFMDEAVKLARKEKLSYIWLGVWEHNDPAIGFYRHEGFYRAGQHIFRLGEDDQTDYIMRKDIGIGGKEEAPDYAG